MERESSEPLSGIAQPEVELALELWIGKMKDLFLCLSPPHPISSVVAEGFKWQRLSLLPRETLFSSYHGRCSPTASGLFIVIDTLRQDGNVDKGGVDTRQLVFILRWQL